MSHRTLSRQFMAKETKEIIPESGISFDVHVTLPDGTKKHFSEFAASGKIVNTYNTILSAREKMKAK